VDYFMVSLDAPEKNRAFAESVGADFVLLSDPDKQNAERYGVLALGGLFTRRWTFYIDGEGVLRDIDKSVNTSTHGGDVVARLASLGIGREATSSTGAP
jgi:peroxiredoxin Q/BCP